MSESSDDSDKKRNILLTDFLSMCRLCLSKTGIQVDIFQENQSVSLPLRIMACASLEVSASDQLPKRICDDCRYQLEKSYVFRKRCKNSDTKIRRYFRQLNAGKISQLFENSDDEDEYAESQEFFNARQQEKMQQIEKEREERERDFQQRMKNFMEEERRRFHDEETKRLLEEHRILGEEKRDAILLNTSDGQQINESPCVKKLKMEIILNKEQEEANIEFFEEEKIDQIDEEYIGEIEEQETGEQNEDEIEFILNEEEDLVTSENNIDENVEYEKDDEADSDYEPETFKESESDTSKEPLLLNRNLKSAISMEEEHFVFSIKPDKTNQYIIKPSTSKKTDDEEPTQESESKNLIDDIEANKDIDFAHLTTAVRSILAQQVGLNVNGDVKFKVLKRRKNVAEVEVRTPDGTIIVMEVELDSMLKDSNGELKIFGCTECSRSFSRKAQLQRHATTHVKEKGFSCGYCEKWFPSKSGLDRHVRVHTGEKPFKCDVCGKSFIQKEILKRHTMVHTGERPYKCKFCDKGFTQNDMLRFHVNRKHSDNPVVELRKCPLCSKTFSYASGLSRHLTVHTGKIFPCLYCSKKFNDGSAHKRHVTTVHRLLNTNS